MARYWTLFEAVCAVCLVAAFWYFYMLYDSPRDLPVLATLVFVVPGVTWVVISLGRSHWGWGRDAGSGREGPRN